jgi:hypothetical protein
MFNDDFTEMISADKEWQSADGEVLFTSSFAAEFVAMRGNN